MVKLLYIFPVLLSSTFIQAQPNVKNTVRSTTGWGKDTISIHTSNEAEALRERLKDYIWGNGAWTTVAPVKYETHVDLRLEVPGEYTHLRNLEYADKLTIPMLHGFKSVVYVLHPKKSNGSHIPLIYHSGHNYDLFHEDRHTNDSGACAVSVLEFFLDKGFDIVGISMPLAGYNKYPQVVRENGREIHIFRHDDLFALRHPFYYFLEPVKATLDFLTETCGYQRYIMMGLSGGGWTTTVYSALDTRVWLSFPVAGSIPLALPSKSQDNRDSEQNYAGLYGSFNYSTLYTLAADGPGRMTCQILNQKDDCCFAYDAERYWAPEVRNRLAAMGEPGQYEFYFDSCAPFHKISAASVQKIYEEIQKAFTRAGYSLTE